MTAPHLNSAHPPLTIRRGSFWVTGNIDATPFGPAQIGPMHVEWEAPETPTKPPIVLVHGGGGQATDWKTTPDGRPGWADRLVRHGHPVYLVDRPGHGRSPAHPDILGPFGPAGGYGSTAFVFVPPEAPAHTQWPWGRSPGSAELDQLTAAAGFLPADIALAQRRDADRLTELLERIGPAILLTHSAGSPAAWLVGMERPELVRALVAIEPMGPPNATIPGVGTLTHGLSAAEPRVTAADGMRHLATVPIAVVTGETSVFVPAGHAITEYLSEHQVANTLIHLPDLGITGNGHGLFFEANSDATLTPITDWLETHH